MVKIHRLKGDITPKLASSFKGSIAIDTEATGLKIPERDKLSLIQICGEDGEVYIIQPDRNNYKAPNLVSLLENEKILKIGHFLRFDKNALEYFLKCKMKNIFDTKIASKVVINRTFLTLTAGFTRGCGRPFVDRCNRWYEFGSCHYRRGGRVNRKRRRSTRFIQHQTLENLNLNEQQTKCHRHHDPACRVVEHDVGILMTHF